MALLATRSQGRRFEVECFERYSFSRRGAGPLEERGSGAPPNINICFVNTAQVCCQDFSNVEAARVEIYKQRQAAKKQLYDLRAQLEGLNAQMRSQSAKLSSKQAKSNKTFSDDDEVQALGTRGGGVSASRSRHGEEHLVKWIELLDQNGNTNEHHIARSLAYQCREIASDPTFRPMLSDVVPTFILPDKRNRKPTDFYKIGDETSNTADVDNKKASKKRKSEPKKESAVTKKEAKLEKKRKKVAASQVSFVVYHSFDK